MELMWDEPGLREWRTACGLQPFHLDESHQGLGAPEGEVDAQSLI